VRRAQGVTVLAGSSRAAGYTTKPMRDHMDDSNARTVLIAQIEDAEALDQLDEIAAVDGIDCLFVGRMDLTVSLGADSPMDQRVIDAVERICAAGRRHGKAVGMFIGPLEDCARWQSLGASLFILGSDHQFLLEGARALVRRLGPPG
jgi:2-keto-3-deoxy-L-rhamnonate aldolase RhmA